MEVSFGNQAGSAAAPTVAAPAEVTNPTPTNTAVATTTALPPPSTRTFLLGDRLPKFSDVILPRLNIVQPSSKIVDSFPQGALVFDQKLLLHTPVVIDKTTGNVTRPMTPPVKLYVVGVISDRFAEKVQGGIGGLIVDSETAVRENGGTLDYKEWQLKRASGMRRFENLTDLLVLIERPELCKDDGIVFNFEREKTKFCLAAWAVKGGAYTAVMKRVLNYNRLAGYLMGGFPTYAFTLATRLEAFKTADGAFSAWMPVITPAGKTTEGILAFIHEIAGSPV